MVKIKRKKLVAESNRDIKRLIREFVAGKVQESWPQVLDSNGWVTINKGIFIRKYFNERKQIEFLQVAVEKGKFDNEYLMEHTLILMDKFLEQEAELPVEGTWDENDGKELNIVGKGPTTVFRYREIAL